MADDKEFKDKISNTNSRVLRGGSFNINATNVRSSYCNNILPANQFLITGFRVARTYR